MFWYFEALFNYCKFSGRCSRAQYWWFMLFFVLGTCFFGCVDYASPTFVDIDREIVVGEKVNLQFQPVWSHLYFWLTLLPFLAINVRRLHDTERSGWNVLLGFFPILFFILVYFQAQRGTEGENRFGESIKGTLPVKATYRKVVKALFISIIVVTFLLISFAYTDIYNKGELSSINGLDGFVKSLSLVIYGLCALLALTFCLDWGKRQKAEQVDEPDSDDEFAGLGLDGDQSDDAGFDDEDEFEELEPLNMDADPLEDSLSGEAEDFGTV